MQSRSMANSYDTVAEDSLCFGQTLVDGLCRSCSIALAPLSIR